MPLFSAHAQHGSQHQFRNFPLLSWANSCPWRAVGRVSFREATVIQVHSWINDELLWRQRLSFPRDTFVNVKGLHMYGSTPLYSTPNKTTQDASTVYYMDALISASGITQMSATPTQLWLRHTVTDADCWLCKCLSLQTVYYTSTQQFHIGLLSPTVDDDDNKCLVDVNSRLRLIECSYATAKRMKLHWLFTQVKLSLSWLLLNYGV